MLVHEDLLSLLSHFGVRQLLLFRDSLIIRLLVSVMNNPVLPCVLEFLCAGVFTRNQVVIIG